MMQVAAAAGSLLVHLLVVFILLWQPKPAPTIKQEVGGGAPISVELLPKLADEELKQLPQREEGTPIQNPPEQKLCIGDAQSYVGIGIVYSTFSMRIIDAPESYPGYRAGLRVDDVLLIDPTEKEDRAVGSYVIYRVLRDNEQLTFRIKMEQICYQQKMTP